MGGVVVGWVGVARSAQCDTALNLKHNKSVRDLAAFILIEEVSAGSLSYFKKAQNLFHRR